MNNENIKSNKPADAPSNHSQDSSSIPTTNKVGTEESYRNPDGTFKKGHPQFGHAIKGQKHALSQRAQLALMKRVVDEVENERFEAGLNRLYMEDIKGYYQTINNMAKFAAPTLLSESVELSAGEETSKTLDDILDVLMKSRQQ